MPLFGKDKTAQPAQTQSNTKSSNGGSGIMNVLHRNKDEDPAIRDARARVLNAEEAERQADRALMQARVAVRDAREHVKRLEKEAAEEARLAKIKQGQAADLGKRGQALGRHGK